MSHFLLKAIKTSKEKKYFHDQMIAKSVLQIIFHIHFDKIPYPIYGCFLQLIESSEIQKTVNFGYSISFNEIHNFGLWPMKLFQAELFNNLYLNFHFKQIYHFQILCLILCPIHFLLHFIMLICIIFLFEWNDINTVLWTIWEPRSDPA